MKLLKLEKIKNDDIASLHSILVECGIKMYEQFNLCHWYPFMNLSTFKQTMKNKDLYGIYQNDLAIATFNVSMISRDYYFEELWSNPNEKALYLGQFGIHPTHQKNGVGIWCMNQIEKIGYEKGCRAIRFDGVSNHPFLKKFYTKLGYKVCGVVTPNQWELTCYEKILI